jgi:Protein of unknown function (DUF2934)
MHYSNGNTEQSVQEAAYFMWEREGRPEGRARDHWERASKRFSGANRGRADTSMDDEEKVVLGRPDANMPALLTRDVPGG